MFAYIRYLSAVLFIIVLVASFYAGVYFRSTALEQVLKPTLQEQADILVSSFRKKVWLKHVAEVQKAKSILPATWKSSEPFKALLEDSRNLFSQHNFTRINIYDQDKEQLFSSSRKKFSIFASDEYDKLFQEALKGKSTGTVDQVTLKDGGEEGQTNTVIHILLPIMAEDNSTVQAIAEVFYDVSFANPHLFAVQVVITAGIIVVALTLYSILFFLSWRAERMIERLHESNQELENAKERAENESREKSKFLANVSHELRTPLNAIIGFSDIIKNEVMGPVGNEQYADYVRDINSSGIHLLSLINDILDYSKAEAGKLEVECINIDLNKVIRTSLRLVSPRAEEAKLKLIEDIPEKHLVVFADPKRLKQVLLNFLSNAVKFTPEGGEVRLTAKETNYNKITIEIRDTGIGIAPKDIAKAMSTFGQVDNSLSRRYEGTGLGLPFSKKLVDMMGGTFDIQSEVGLGTTITLIFPMATMEVAEGEVTQKGF